MAIQAVHDAIRTLEVRLDDLEGDPLDDTEMLLAYTRAADELRQAYEIARLNTSNLPPYDQLVPPPDRA
ncbi:hypothetical protein [Paraburkholderia caffeinitolerans]|nr:hypothetical protein [Paraburkholderia caffeinitolerans]